MKKIFTIFILLFAACTTEPVEVHDDNTVLQKLFNDSTIECAELPDSICVWENGRITRLNCYNNSLTGGIPENIGKLTELTQLGLKSNDLKGEIPESMGDLINLTQLSLGNDSLSGIIPESIGKLKKLTLLDLSHNQLSGSIPEAIGELTAMQTLFADSNNFSGSIPESLCDIENLDVSNNQFCASQPFCIDTPELMGYQSCECTTAEEMINGYCYSQTDLTILREIISNANSINMNLDIYQPSDFQLFAPFPNPFNPLAKIEYNLPYTGDISLVIYDIMGRQVEILYNGKQHLGNYTISWDASNYSSGVYFIKMNVGDSQSSISQSRKVVLLK